jgi:hypothetical protein
MGWATYLMHTMEFSKETYKTKYEVEQEIEESKRIIEICEKDLYSFGIMTEPNKFCPEENDPILWLRNEIEDNIQLIKEETIKLYKLETLLENWDKCHNEKGDAIIPKDKELWNKVYMDGDFIETVVEE